MNNKKIIKGFTMTELIATLVILGIVVAIAIPGVGKLLNKFKSDYYKELNNTIITSGKTYYRDKQNSKPSGLVGIVS